MNMWNTIFIITINPLFDYILLIYFIDYDNDVPFNVIYPSYFGILCHTNTKNERIIIIDVEIIIFPNILF